MTTFDAAEAALSGPAIEILIGNRREFLRFLERRVSPAEAEDILQQAFVKGLENANTLRDGESVMAWFYRILRNAVIDRHRRRGATGRGLESLARELDQTVQPVADLQQAVCACVGRLADTLKPEYADALRRIEIDGLSVQAYAAELGIQPNNAAVRVHRAREGLRKRLMASCGSCAEHGCLDCTCKQRAPE